MARLWNKGFPKLGNAAEGGLSTGACSGVYEGGRFTPAKGAYLNLRTAHLSLRWDARATLRLVQKLRGPGKKETAEWRIGNLCSSSLIFLFRQRLELGRWVIDGKKDREKRNEKDNGESFRAQRDHRIHFRGAERGEQAGDRGDGEEQRGVAGEGDRVVRADAVELAL